jgi:hypothetical protein
MKKCTSGMLPIEQLIEGRSYFVFHAPRQTGKSTAMAALAKQLTDSGRYTAILLSAEVGSAFNQQPDQAEKAILAAWQSTATIYLPPELCPPIASESWKELVFGQHPSGQRINEALRQWAETSPRPLVVFIDEIDSLQDNALLMVLRQLRDGFPSRPRAFPQSVGLVGLRDVRDYKVAAGGSDRLHTASPFNIKAESLTLRNFNASEVAELCLQHTADTGQVFTPEALQHIYDLTLGQPWLVNALARQMTEVLQTDRAIALTKATVDQAKELLIQRQDTHLDSLAERLREPRIKAIMEPMLAGQELGAIPNEDIQFVLDLGLCRIDTEGGLVIANPIYREVMPRVLAFTPRAALPRIAPSWLTPAGKLDVEQLLAAFLKFWRQHGEPLLRSASYHEIAPHLVLMAFLHRVVNGDGTLEREYAIGSDRMDLCMRYGEVTLGIELKVWRKGRKDPLVAGLEQLDGYLAGLSLETGWLIIFDRRPDLPPIEERTALEVAQTPSGRTVSVVRA